MHTAQSSGRTFLTWLAFAGLLALGGVVFVQLGMLTLFIEQDSSRLSLVILAGLVLATAHAGYCAYRLDRESAAASALAAKRSPEPLATESIALDYRNLVRAAERNKDRHSEPSNLGAYLEQRVHAGHASGWFVADLMIKLGLLGTVVGFIFMLNSVAQMETTDLNAAKLMLTQMSSGMRIALFTTLAGLSSGLILGAQYQLLDRSADRLFRQIIRLIDTGSASENGSSGQA
ncbi:MAG: MotA/TolQ/ExbB proton channel family protein [Gammaproteobacteria bacterium]